MKKLIVVILVMLLLCGCGATQNVPAQTGSVNNTPGEPSAGGTTAAAQSVDVSQLYAQLEALGMPEMLEMEASMRLDIYGIAPEDVRQAKVMVCSDGLRADEIWLVEAVDEAAAQTIKGLAENRVKQKDAESVTYSPEQNVIVKKAVVKTEGSFVYFICSPDVDAMVAVVETALGN